jgi:hypothetical protein
MIDLLKEHSLLTDPKLLEAADKAVKREKLVGQIQSAFRYGKTEGAACSCPN